MQTQLISRTSTHGGVVEILKKMLISRDIVLQLKAVGFMINAMDKFKNNNELCTAVTEHFLSNDLCIFLCEASATLQAQLLKNIIICLKKFSALRLFYNNSYAPVVVSSIGRTIHFLVKENVLETILQHALYFLSEVFFQVDTFKLSGVLSSESFFNPHQLMELLCGIMVATGLEIETMLAASLVLHSMISQKSNKTNVNLKTLAFTSEAIQKCLQTLCQLIIENHFKCSLESKIDYVFGMLCHIAIDALNFIKICEFYCHKKYLYIDYTECDNEAKQGAMKSKEIIIESVNNILMAITTQLKNFDSTIIVPNTEVFLNLLSMFLNDSAVQDNLSLFVHHLYNNGFIAFLQKEMSSKNNSSRNSPAIMARILYTLSTETFTFSNWKGGAKSFENHLYEGLVEIKPTTNLWIHKLNDAKTTDASINGILVFYYFLFLKSEKPEDASILHSSLLEFILSMPNTRCPDPTIKCLWFLFAMAGTSINKQSLPIEQILKLGKATGKIAFLISAKTKDLYTHHPLMTCWAFSSNRISREIQRNMLSLWFEREDSLPFKLRSKCTVWSSLVELIQYGSPNVLKYAADQLKHCIDTYCDQNTADDISEILWGSLPGILSSFAVGKMNVTDVTVCQMLDLCCKYIPAHVQPSTVERSASLLITILTSRKQEFTSISIHIISGAFCLLNISLKQDNTIVLSQFINSPELLQFVYDASQSDDAKLSTSALMMLSFSLYYQEKHGLQCENTIQFRPSSIITSLKLEKDNEKVVAILQLLYTMLAPRKQHLSALLIIAPQYPKAKYITTFKALFFRLQMVCCKESKMESDSALECLNGLLRYAGQKNGDSQLIVALSHQPWTHILIKFFLYQNKINQKFLKFVYNWLHCIKVIMKTQKSSNNIAQSLSLSQSSSISQSFSCLVNAFQKPESLETLNTENKIIMENIIGIISSFFDFENK